VAGLELLFLSADDITRLELGAAEVLDAVEAFAAHREPLANGPSALATHRVVAALYESAKRDAWVEL